MGVLDRRHGPDDGAVFVDIKTAWIIAGIGHGHDDVILAEAGRAPADAMEHRRVTPETIDSFHFHGDPDAFPVSSVLVVPPEARIATILRGRYLDPEGPMQIVVLEVVVQGLVDRIVRIKGLLDAVTAITVAATLAAIGRALIPDLRAARRRDAHGGPPRGGPWHGPAAPARRDADPARGGGVVAAGSVGLVTIRSQDVVDWIVALGA